MLRILSFCLMLISSSSLAQFTYVIDQTIPVKKIDNSNYATPWAGGLNSTQFNQMDLDHDGVRDLVLFDRMANKVITYLRRDQQFQYAPQYENFFPPEVSNFMLLRDYDLDARPDIFTADVLGIKVFRNTTEKGESPSWEPFFFYYESGLKSEVLLTKGFTQKVNLQLQFDDLPAIVDADNDGDLDIFCMKYIGSGTVEFHKNFSMERYNTRDSLDFERITQNWGNFKECHCGEFAFNGDACNEGGRVKHVSGKSLLALDVTEDGEVDLLFGEGECKQLFLLTNEGTLLNPIITLAVPFPQNAPVEIDDFPAAFYHDVDYDGTPDLVASTNLFHKETLTPTLDKSIWFYKNNGTFNKPQLTLVKTNFLQGDMIDVGDHSKPAFADADGDGDQDLFISNNYTSTGSRIFFYRNDGSTDAPAFKLADEDYLLFSQKSFYNLKIQYYDIDHNNTTDLVFTATSLSTHATDIHFIPNKSQSQLDFSGQSVLDIDFAMLYDDNVTFTDIDLDGKSDFLVGRNNGTLQYWRNTSPMSGQFSFALNDDSYAGLGASDDRQNLSTAIADLDEDGKADLIFGDHEGSLHVVSDFRSSNETIESDIIYNPLNTSYTHHNFGGHIWPTAAKLYEDEKPLVFLGNTLGGLHALRNDGGESIPSNPIIDVYPNPYSKSTVLKVKVSEAATVQVISVTGQQLNEPVSVEAHELYHFPLPQLSRGVYLLKFTVAKKSFTRRLVIL